MATTVVDPKNIILFDLNTEWTLGYDELQWMVMKKGICNGKPTHRPVAFVASTKAVLSRVMDDLDITLTDAANHAITRLPESFRGFLNMTERSYSHAC